jgi:hypothetical protein
MKIKNISVGIAGTIMLVAIGLPRTAVAEDIVMDLQFAGGFVASGIKHLDLSTRNPVDTTASPLIHVQAQGSPDNAVIRGFGAGGDAVPVVVFECLGSFGVFLSIIATEDPLLFTFDDLSLLFADGTGEICIDLTTGISEFRFDIVFFGGRGDFANATGTAVITGEAVPVSADGSFLAETGTILGTITVPD